MLTFLDDLAECLSNRCICCQLSGRSICLLKDNHPARQILNSAAPNHLDCALAACPESEGSSTGHVHHAWKRVYGQSSDANCVESNIGQNKKQHTIELGSSADREDLNHASLSSGPAGMPSETSDDLMSLVSFHDHISSSLLLAYRDLPEVVFVHRMDKPPSPLQVLCTWFAPDPWSSGNLPPSTPSALIQFLTVCI